MKPPCECGSELQYPAPDSFVRNLEATLREHYPGAGKLVFEEASGMLDLMLADLKRDFVLFDIIFLLTAILAGLGVLNGQLLAALERKKEQTL